MAWWLLIFACAVWVKKIPLSRKYISFKTAAKPSDELARGSGKQDEGRGCAVRVEIAVRNKDEIPLRRWHDELCLVRLHEVGVLPKQLGRVDGPTTQPDRANQSPTPLALIKDE